MGFVSFFTKIFFCFGVEKQNLVCYIEKKHNFISTGDAMSNISKIDKNFIVDTQISKDDIKFYNVNEAPFKVYGVHYTGDNFVRLPAEVAKTVNEGVFSLHNHTAGGRVRFKTDSPYIAINVKILNSGKRPHFALTGSTGFDLYGMFGEEERYIITFVPPFDVTGGYEMVKEMGNCGMREYTINFPLYSSVKELYIGLAEGARVEEAAPYRDMPPIVYYGSSITQGACASRPGSTYQAHITRRFRIDHINLGFAGSAKAEDEIIDYIKGLSMSCFVLDYDHNSPSAEHLSQTHEKMFKAVREAHPDIPIILMPKPIYYIPEGEKPRQEIIKATYKNALKAGDKNVYFIESNELMALCGNEGTVDGCHPTDLGFYSMAKAVERIMEKIF